MVRARLRRPLQKVDADPASFEPSISRIAHRA
jgi:hypothetical protein